MAILRKFPEKHFATPKLKSEVYEYLQTAISQPHSQSTYQVYLSWKKSGPTISSTSSDSLDKWSWLVKSSTWSRDVILTRFLDQKLHIIHVTKVMTSIVFLCRGLNSQISVLLRLIEWGIVAWVGWWNLLITLKKGEGSSFLPFLLLKMITISVINYSFLWISEMVSSSFMILSSVLLSGLYPLHPALLESGGIFFW